MAEEGPWGNEAMGEWRMRAREGILKEGGQGEGEEDDMEQGSGKG